MRIALPFLHSSNASSSSETGTDKSHPTWKEKVSPAFLANTMNVHGKKRKKRYKSNWRENESLSRPQWGRPASPAFGNRRLKSLRSSSARVWGEFGIYEALCAHLPNCLHQNTTGPNYLTGKEDPSSRFLHRRQAQRSEVGQRHASPKETPSEVSKKCQEQQTVLLAIEAAS